MYFNHPLLYRVKRILSYSKKSNFNETLLISCNGKQTLPQCEELREMWKFFVFIRIVLFIQYLMSSLQSHVHCVINLIIRVSCSNYSYSNYSNTLRYSNLEYFWPNIRTIRIPKNRQNWPIFRENDLFFRQNRLFYRGNLPKLDKVFKKPWTYLTNSIAIK